jgi:hypothetical protein
VLIRCSGCCSGGCRGRRGRAELGEQKRDADRCQPDAGARRPRGRTVRFPIAVDAFPLRAAALARTDVLCAAFLAAVTSGLLAAFGPPAGDAPAHLYRTLLFEERAFIWDNLWYAGDYPFASYSLLYYPVASLFGNVPVAACAAVVSAALFAWIANREWGKAARPASLAFALVICAPLVTGTYAYAAGVAFALAALAALQAGAVAPALLAALLAIGFSPLAFVFLCLVLLAVVAVRRPGWRRAVLIAGGLGVAAGLELAVLLLFPSDGRYGFRASELALTLVAAGVGAAIAALSPRGRILVALFMLWALVCLVAFLVPSPLGSNVVRLRIFVLPLILLSAALSGYRPRWLSLPAVVAALVYSLSPLVTVATELGDTRAARESFWAPALAFLQERGSADYRVDVVPTFDNWEAYYVPREGHALARGWYRQLDLSRNPELYRDHLAPEEYRRWLRSLGVRFVLLPGVPLDRLGAEPQAELLRSGRSGLREVWNASGWRIFELPAATPILSGPGAAHITLLEHERLTGIVLAPGVYRLRIRYTPYWDVRSGAICLERAGDDMTRLTAARAGPFEVGIALRGASSCGEPATTSSR